jgi:hypothetical protein
MTTSDLNAALAAYVCATLPKDEALERWLEEHCPPANQAVMRADVRSVADEATDAVCREAGGVRFTPEFWQRLHALLGVKHPWLTLAGTQRLQGFLGWYCWHEGLYAPGEI